MPVRNTFVILCLLLLGLPGLAQDMTVPAPDALKTWRRIAATDAASSSTCIGRIDTLSCALDTEMACHFRSDPALCGLAYRAGTLRRQIDGVAPDDGRIWLYKLRGGAIYKGEGLLDVLDAISENGFSIHAQFILNSLRKPRPGDALVMVDRVRCYSPRTEADCMEEGWRTRNAMSPETLVFRFLPGQGWQAVGDNIDPDEIAATLAAARARLPHLPPPDAPGQWRQVWRDPAVHPGNCDPATDTIACAYERLKLCVLRRDPKLCRRSGLDAAAMGRFGRLHTAQVYRLRGAVEYRGEDQQAAIEPLLGYYVNPFHLRYMNLGKMRKGDILLGVDANICETADIAACIAEAEERMAEGDPPGIMILRRDKRGWYAFGIGGPNH